MNKKIPGWVTFELKDVNVNGKTRVVTIKGLVLIVNGGNGGKGSVRDHMNYGLDRKHKILRFF